MLLHRVMRWEADKQGRFSSSAPLDSSRPRHSQLGHPYAGGPIKEQLCGMDARPQRVVDSSLLQENVNGLSEPAPRSLSLFGETHNVHSVLINVVCRAVPGELRVCLAGGMSQVVRRDTWWLCISYRMFRPAGCLGSKLGISLVSLDGPKENKGESERDEP